MARPNIQIDDEVREMTEEEYEALLASGWTEEGKVIWRASFVALLLTAILVACGDRERVNCPPLTKNKALRAATTITVDTASVGSSRIVSDKCP